MIKRFEIQNFFWKFNDVPPQNLDYSTQRAVGLNNQTKKAMMFINFAN